MIKSSNYSQAAVVACELASKGIYLQPTSMSVLEELVDATVSPVTVKTTDLPVILSGGSANSSLSISLDQRSREVEWTTGDQGESSDHSKRIMALAEDISPFITSHISHTRNVVKPHVVELTKKLEHYLEISRTNDPASEFEIRQAVVPSIMLDESFLSDGLSDYQNVQSKYAFFALSIKPAQITDEFVLEMLHAGKSERLAKLIDEWVSSIGGLDFIKKVVDHNFAVSFMGTQTSVDYKQDLYLGKGIGNYSRLNIGLICYIVGTYFYNNVQESDAQSLAKYKEIVRNFIDFAASEIWSSYRSIQRQLESGLLVSETVKSEKRITVHKVAYQEWLKTGGSPEILLGLLTAGKSLFDKASISEQRDNLLASWHAYVTVAQAEARLKLKENFASYALAECMSMVSEPSEAELEYFVTKAELVRKVEEKTREQIERMNHRLMEDLSHTALHLVAKGRFFYTSAYSILNEMREAEKANPEIDPREAALLSTISYFVEYIAAQVTSVK